MVYGIVLTIHILVSFVLIAVILLQAGRGGGVAETFGGSAQSILGTRGVAFLTRATTACATIFMLTSLTLAILSAQRGRSLMEAVKEEAPPAAQEPAPSPSP
jgi:preprotein translocase subunit SecG